MNFSPKDNSKLEGLLRRYFAPPTAAWLLREMADNRQKGLALTKAYSYPDLRWAGGWVGGWVGPFPAGQHCGVNQH